MSRRGSIVTARAMSSGLSGVATTTRSRPGVDMTFFLLTVPRRLLAKRRVGTWELWADGCSSAHNRSALLAPDLLEHVAVAARRVEHVAVRHVLLRDQAGSRDERRRALAGER